MTNYIYLAASIVNGISAVVSLFKGDILLSNTNLVLAILFLDWYKKDVSVKVSSDSINRIINNRQER